MLKTEIKNQPKGYQNKKIEVRNFYNWNLLKIYNLLFDFHLSTNNKLQTKNQKLISTKHQTFGIQYITHLFLFAFLILVLESCSYSFTGSSVPKHLKTISIPYCVDRSGSGEPNMADDFTNTLIEQFVSDNSLQVTDKADADAMLDCTITSISDTPTIIEGGENVSKRRITINAHVVYKDNVKRKTVFDKSFSAYSDYLTNGDVFSLRRETIKEAINQLTEDILLGVVSNW